MELSSLLERSFRSNEQDSSELTKRLAELDHHSLTEIMTPRSIINALDIDVQLNRVRRLSNAKEAYFPVYKGDLNNIVGWVSKLQAIELLESPIDGVSLHRYVRPIGKISATTSISELAEYFLKTRSPFLVVTDAVGGTLGVINLTDFIELLFLKN
jgi:putative hemolysin